RTRRCAVAVFQPIYLTGDYVGKHARQQSAFAQQCVCVLEFHFNSSTNKSMRGGEVHHQPQDDGSREFAQARWDQLNAVGLPPSGASPVKSTKESPRSSWIDHYAMIAVVLEPLFISNSAQADWLHQNTGNLAEAITTAIQGTFPDGGRIGLS